MIVFVTDGVGSRLARRPPLGRAPAIGRRDGTPGLWQRPL